MFAVPGVEVVDLALKYEDTLIVGDLQLGYEDYLTEQGLLVPRFQAKDILERLKKILSAVRVKRVVLNGDVKHEFGRISRQEWRDVTALLDFLTSSYEVVVIKGNHDILLEYITEKKNIHVQDSFEIGNLTITHGDKILKKHKKVIVIGHEHPAISFRERKGEKFKCFLVGSWKDHELIVMPSFSAMTEGSDVTQSRFLSPYLKNGVDDFRVIVVSEGKILPFGKVKEFVKK